MGNGLFDARILKYKLALFGSWLPLGAFLRHPVMTGRSVSPESLSRAVAVEEDLAIFKTRDGRAEDGRVGLFITAATVVFMNENFIEANRIFAY